MAHGRLSDSSDSRISFVTLSRVVRYIIADRIDDNEIHNLPTSEFQAVVRNGLREIRRLNEQELNQLFHRSRKGTDSHTSLDEYICNVICEMDPDFFHDYSMVTARFKTYQDHTNRSHTVHAPFTDIFNYAEPLELALFSLDEGNDYTSFSRYKPDFQPIRKGTQSPTPWSYGKSPLESCSMENLKGLPDQGVYVRSCSPGRNDLSSTSIDELMSFNDVFENGLPVEMSFSETMDTGRSMRSVLNPSERAVSAIDPTLHPIHGMTVKNLTKHGETVHDTRDKKNSLQTLKESRSSNAYGYSRVVISQSSMSQYLEWAPAGLGSQFFWPGSKEMRISAMLDSSKETSKSIRRTSAFGSQGGRSVESLLASPKAKEGGPNAPSLSKISSLTAVVTPPSNRQNEFIFADKAQNLYSSCKTVSIEMQLSLAFSASMSQLRVADTVDNSDTGHLASIEAGKSSIYSYSDSYSDDENERPRSSRMPKSVPYIRTDLARGMGKSPGLQRFLAKPTPTPRPPTSSTSTTKSTQKEVPVIRRISVEDPPRDAVIVQGFEDFNKLCKPKFNHMGSIGYTSRLYRLKFGIPVSSIVRVSDSQVRFLENRFTLTLLDSTDPDSTKHFDTLVLSGRLGKGKTRSKKYKLSKLSVIDISKSALKFLNDIDKELLAMIEALNRLTVVLCFKSHTMPVTLLCNNDDQYDLVVDVITHVTMDNKNITYVIDQKQAENDV